MGEGQIAAAAQETAMKLLNSDNKVQSSEASDVIAIATNETRVKNDSADRTNQTAIYTQSDLIRRLEKLNRSMQEILISGPKGTNISAVYAKTAVMPSISPALRYR